MNVDETYFNDHDLDPKAFLAKDPKGKEVRVVPSSPAVILTDPKYPHNLGQTVRALSCFEVPQLWWSGKRMLKALEGMDRIPREERMRGYSDVSILHHERPLEVFQTNKEIVPVAIELRPNSESLIEFIHPPNAVYIFGPEDGSIDQGTLRNCHRFVKIPIKHCSNLSAAVYMVLYDRALKLAKPDWNYSGG